MGKQTELLGLQEADSALDRLRKQRDEIPERAEADGLRSDVEKAASLVAALEAELHEAERTQSRLENEISGLSDKIAREEKKLYGGTVANPKELGSIQEEIKMLDKQRDELETTLLEQMEVVEASQSKVAEAASRKAALESKHKDKEEVFSGKAAELDEQIAAQEAVREAAAAKVQADLLSHYEKIRAQKGGTAVGEVIEGICGACRVELPAEELDRMLNSETLWRCPQCRRILVERG